MKYYQYYNNQDRQFLVPFLLGGLGGAAIVSTTRPRPVYVNPPQNFYPPAPYPNFGPGPGFPGGYGYNYYSSYNYNPYFR